MRGDQVTIGDDPRRLVAELCGQVCHRLAQRIGPVGAQRAVLTVVRRYLSLNSSGVQVHEQFRGRGDHEFFVVHHEAAFRC